MLHVELASRPSRVSSFVQPTVKEKSMICNIRQTSDFPPNWKRSAVSRSLSSQFGRFRNYEYILITRCTPKVVGSIPGRDRPKSLKLVVVASPPWRSMIMEIALGLARQYQDNGLVKCWLRIMGIALRLPRQYQDNGLVKCWLRIMGIALGLSRQRQDNGLVKCWLRIMGIALGLSRQYQDNGLVKCWLRIMGIALQLPRQRQDNGLVKDYGNSTRTGPPASG